MSSATHTRLHTSLLAAAEKRLLIWMAGRLPRWIHSDHLTALGLAAMAGAGLSFFWVRRHHPSRCRFSASGQPNCELCWQLEHSWRR